MTFDDQIRAALDSTAAGLREHVEAQLRAFAQQAIRAAVEERQQAVQAATDAARAEVRSHAEALVAEIRSQAEAQVAQIRAAAQKHADEVKRAAEAQITEMRKTLEELRTQALAERERARAEIDTANAEIDRARADMDAARSEAERAQANAESARAQADAARAEAQAARADAEAARTEVAAARADVVASRAEVVASRADAQAARGDAEAARVETQSARSAVEDARAAAHADVEEKIAGAVARTRSDLRRSALSRAAWLIDALRQLDEARGISTVLDRLVQSAAHEVERAAMLVVKGDRLIGWRLEGFAADGPAAKSIDVSVEQAGIAGVVLQTGLATSRLGDADEGPALPPFAGTATGRDAAAIPVLVGGEVVAVLYADASSADADVDAPWHTTLEVLVRHGSRVLEAITVLQAAGLPLPQPMARGSHMAEHAAMEQA